MASFKAKFPVFQELFAKNHRGALWPPPSGARVNRPVLMMFMPFFSGTSSMINPGSGSSQLD